MERDKYFTIFLNPSCPKTERYYICRLKLRRLGEVAQLVRASRLKIGKAAREL
jgi:hypothetical protein